MKNKAYDFWVIVGLLIVLMGFMLSMNTRMATKSDLAQVKADLKADISRLEDDIARVEADLKSDIREIRSLLITHINDGHWHKKLKKEEPQKRGVASDPDPSKRK